jgi:SAM-dependent methyltransferase
MRALSPVTALVGRMLDRWLRRGDYRAVWDWQARSAHNARLAVAGVADDRFDRSGEETAAHLCAVAGIRPTDVVLEIGCGTGRVGRALAPRCGHWIGADVSPRMLDHARAALAPAPNVSFAQLDGRSLRPFRDGSIDVAYCTGVFMHLDEWDRYGYVEDGFRVLRPGGRLYVDSLNLLGDDGWQRFLELRALPPRARPPQISRASTPQELEAYLRRAGFSDIRGWTGSLWVSAMGTKPAG